MKLRKRLLFALLVVAAPGVLAQESGRFRLSEHSLNAGGSPVAGVPVSSARFTADPSSIGDGATRQSLAGVRFRADVGFSLAYRPAGEVRQLNLAVDHRRVSWAPEPSVGHYHVYRDSIGALPGLGYGTCLSSAVNGTSYDDLELPTSGSGYFYLVTATNRLHREGTKGKSGSGAIRANPAPCP